MHLTVLDAIVVVGKGIWLPAIAAVVLSLAAACEPALLPIPTAQPLTPATVLTPADVVAVPTQTAAPTTAPPAQAGATDLPPASPADAEPSPAVPAEVVARTEEKVDELSDRMLRPRPVNTDVLWGAFLTYRALGVRNNHMPDIDAPARMLEMWHPGNPCYATLEAEVERLGAHRGLGPVEFNAYFDYVFAQLSPCLDEQWAEVDAERFFANAEAVRADRVSTWFDSIWNRSEGEALTSLGSCREGFHAHQPAVVSAGESPELHSAWGNAMVEFSECRQQTLREELPFVYLGETQLFAFELNDRYTLIALQATLGGHLVAISLQRPYGECWPDFAASIPEVAIATSPAQLVESRDAALRALRVCIEALPEHNPYAEQ